jgi:hypothetical protein
VNLLLAGTTLELLGRAPAYAADLWARVHRDGRASGAFVRGFALAFDRLGLAALAAEGVRRRADEEHSARLRYHAVALVEHAARVVVAMRRVAAEQLGEDGREVFDRRRAAIARIERLAADLASPRGLEIASPGATPPARDEEPELSEAGVGPPAAPRRDWMPVAELADALLADAAALVADIAAAAIARIDREGPPPLDLAIEG